MRREEFETKHGKLGSNVVYLDLDEQQKPPEVLTAGWTDAQLKSKPLSEIDAMITSGEMGLATLKETVAQESARIDGLRMARSRKLQL